MDNKDHLTVLNSGFLSRLKLSTNFAVFLLFFGAATWEAFQSGNWLKVTFWLVIGFVFFVADNLKKAK